MGPSTFVRSRYLSVAVMVFALVSLTAVAGVAQDDPAPVDVASASSADADRPDIIVIMLDDLGYIPDDRVLKRLPNIRRLFLRQGKRFKQAYNEIPMCCPARVPPSWTDGWPLERTCESLLVIDRLVAGLEAAQAKRGRPAYYVLFSDNGMAWGQHGFPLKFVPWSTHMPLYWSGPEIATKATDAWVSIIDLPVTIAELGGATMPWADGRSFVPVLEGEADDHRSELLEMQPPPPEDSGLRYRGWQAIRADDWRYIRWDDGKRELYKVSTDPWELEDLSEEKPGTMAELDARLDVLVEESRG